MSVEKLDALDRCATVRNRLRELADLAAEYAGIPMPIEGEHLVVEPSYPFARALDPPAEDADEPFVTADGYRYCGTFWSSRRRADVGIWERDGKRRAIVWAKSWASAYFRTLGCVNAWGVQQEAAAVHYLGELVSHYQFKCYMLTGMFLESSPRSGVTYVFRRLRPTLAIRSDLKRDTSRVLAALCMHPIAYYAESGAGAMCPTDDVIAHLQLCRGDEVMFWRRSNQHPPDRPEAAL